MAYPFSVFDGFLQAAARAEAERLRAQMNVIRVSSSDDDKRFKLLWKEIGRGL